MASCCKPDQLRRMLDEKKDIQLVDVREYAEFASGHVPGARLIPLGEVAHRTADIDKSRPVVLLCKGGTRAARAAEILSEAGCRDVLTVEGGTDAWVAAGLPVEVEAKAPWALERQVRLVAGSLVLAGLFIPPWPYLSAFVAAGLIFAAVTNTCGMGMLLSKMPWNRPRTSCNGIAESKSCCGQ